MKLAVDIEERSGCFKQITEACSYILHHDPIAANARKYLADRLPQEAQLKYELGYFPNDQNLKYLLSLVDKDILEAVGAVYPRLIAGGSSAHGHFNLHNIVMPFKDVYANTIALVGRTMFNNAEQKELEIQKYKYTFGLNKELHTFGMHLAKDYIIAKNCVICVEGQFDCISCQFNGLKNVVALGGAYMSRYQLFQLHRYTNNIILLLDNDKAGSAGKLKIKKKYSKFANIVSVSIPQIPGQEIKDIDEFIKKADNLRITKIISDLGKEFDEWKHKSV